MLGSPVCNQVPLLCALTSFPAPFPARSADTKKRPRRMPEPFFKNYELRITNYELPCCGSVWTVAQSVQAGVMFMWQCRNLST